MQGPKYRKVKIRRRTCVLRKVNGGRKDRIIEGRREGGGRKEKEFSFPNIFPSPVECTTLANWKKCAPYLSRARQPGVYVKGKRGREGVVGGGLHNARDFVRSIGSPVAFPWAAIRVRGFRGGISSAGWQDSSTRRTVRARMADNLSIVPFFAPSPLSTAPSSTFRRYSGKAWGQVCAADPNLN